MSSTIHIRETPASRRGRGYVIPVQSGRSAATIVRRIYGPYAGITWDGEVGEVHVPRATEDVLMASITLTDGQRGQ